MARRDEAKKRRRLKRQQKRRDPKSAFDNSHDLPEPKNPFGFLKDLKRLFEMTEPARWPGGCDPSLARPDMVKLDFAEWVTGHEPGKSKLRQLEAGFSQGVLAYLPGMDHWAMEEFFWHGLPGDRWHPLDAYLATRGDRFPPAAQAQLRLWKEARLSLLEIGELRDDVAELRAWDPYLGQPAGPWLRVIALNVGGVNYYRKLRGHITLTYVAPWAPRDQLFCAMGYGSAVPKNAIGVLLPFLGLQHPEIVGRPMPWNVSRHAEQEYLHVWETREWHSWLSARLQFPFLALVIQSPRQAPKLRQVVDLLPSTPQQAHDFGIYFDVPLDAGGAGAVGATGITPLDVTSPGLAALQEYFAYRKRVGPPPGMVGQSTFLRIR